MSVYSELIDESDFDPSAPGPQLEPWQPWSLRGAWETLLGRTDMTVWTVREAAQLNGLLSMEDTQVIPIAGMEGEYGEREHEEQ